MGLYNPDLAKPKIEIIKGDYKYTRYIGGGWSVKVIDKTKTEYEPIECEICGIPVKSMYDTFSECKNLITAPKIPNSVTNMDQTFTYCTSLTTAPEIPYGVTDMNRTFEGCISLVNPPEIPYGVIDMYGTFMYCENLITKPEIPSSVECYDKICFGVDFIKSIADQVLSNNEQLSVPSGNDENDSHNEH